MKTYDVKIILQVNASRFFLLVPFEEKEVLKMEAQ
jgi:hypothetical protein